MKYTYLPLYSTKDRFEIYVLLAAGCKVDGYEYGDRCVYFRFVDERKCRKILSQHQARKLKLSSYEMMNAIRDAQAVFCSR